MFANAVRMLHPEPRVRVSAPINVEAVVTDDPATRTLRIHLLGYHAPPQTTSPRNRPLVLPALLEEAPMYRVTVRCGVAIRSSRAVGPATRLEIDGQDLRAVVEDLHGVLVIRY